MFDLPRMSQRDPKWSDRELVDSGLTIGGWGCTLTSACMAASAFGVEIAPDELTDRMNAIGGFDTWGNLNWLKLAESLGLTFGYRWATDLDAGSGHERIAEGLAWKKVAELQDWGVPCLLFIDTNRDERPNHWLCSWNVIGDTRRAIDPWTGQDVAVHDLYGFAFMLGTPLQAEGKLGPILGKLVEIGAGMNIEMNAREALEIIKRP